MVVSDGAGIGAPDRSAAARTAALYSPVTLPRHAMLVDVEADAGGGLKPPGFLMGVGTAGFCVEGGFNGPGEPANNWVRWERTGRVEPSGIACDFWARPEDVLDRAASLGCDAFGLSVEWARLEPVEGELDGGALDRYARVLAMCEERGMAPVVTLHHFTHPWWLGEEYWLTPGSPDRFSEHVARIVPHLSPYCSRWVTVQEPGSLAVAGWLSGAYPPGRKGAVSDAWAVVDNLLTAHVLAYGVIHDVQPGAEVTIGTRASYLYDFDRILTDLLRARSLGVTRRDLDAWVDERRALHDLARPPRGLGELALRKLVAAASPFGEPAGRMARKLRRPSPRRVVGAVYDHPSDSILDVNGFDWYDPDAGHALGLPGRRTSGGRSRHPTRMAWDVMPDPSGLAAWCREQHALTSSLPLWVLENGISTRVRRGRAYPRLDGWDRPRFLRAHLRAVVDGVEDGAPIGAYLHRSLVDGYEWGSYEPRFGIYGMDRARGERGARWLDTDADGKDSAGVYRRLIAGLRSGDRSVLQEG